MTQKKKLAINGFGRIGRSVLRAFLERPQLHEYLEFVAVNEIADTQTIVHLLKYDSTHGRLAAEVFIEESSDEVIVIRQASLEHRLRLSHAEAIDELNWNDVDIVLECTGQFSERETGLLHLQQGAAKVLYSQPAKADVDATIVYGVNEKTLMGEEQLVSNASCTTNAVVPVVKALHDNYGITSGAITTLHSAMNDQPVIDLL